MASLYRLDAAAEASVGQTVTLDGAEGRHAVTVARVRVGERLRLSDGHGTMLIGSVTAVAAGTISLLVEQVDTEAVPHPRLVLVQALAKGGRDDMAVQAATEIGVDAIVPWAAARSVSRWEGPKVAKGRARWTTIAQEAAKQAIRARTPTVDDLSTTAQLAASVRDAPTTAMLVLDPTADRPLSAWTPDEQHDTIALVVGPEGGIADDELERLAAAGAVRLRLGKSVLRTSTAGPVALAILQTRLGRW